MVTISLLRLVGSSKSALDHLADALGEQNIAGKDVVLDFRECRVSTDTYLRTVVLNLLIERRARQIIVRNATEEQWQQVHRAAKRNSLDGSLVREGIDPDEVDPDAIECICNVRTLRVLGCICGKETRDEFLAFRRMGTDR